MRKLLKYCLLAGMALAPLTFSASAKAQAYTNSASNQWGTATAGVPGMSDSVLGHFYNGQTATQAANARNGGLATNTTKQIYTIGVQNVQSTTISGTGNTVAQSGTQSGKNTGNLSTQGQISGGSGGNNVR